MGYSNHHWKRLLSLFGKMLIVMVKVLNWGFSVGSPRQVIALLNAYNKSKLCIDNFERGLEQWSYDIKEFFTHVSQTDLIECVNDGISQIRRQDPMIAWF